MSDLFFAMLIQYYEETKVATTSSKALNTPLQALGANRAIEKQFSELHNFLVESGVAVSLQFYNAFSIDDV